MEHQDWEYKVIEKKGTSKQAMEALNEQGRVVTVAKHEHLNKTDLDGKHVAKVLNEENTAIDHVSHNFSLALQQARQGKNLTQEKLGALVNETKQTIQSYENGKAIPQPGVINKLEHALGVQLPREKKHKEHN